MEEHSLWIADEANRLLGTASCSAQELNLHGHLWFFRPQIYPTRKSHSRPCSLRANRISFLLRFFSAGSPLVLHGKARENPASAGSGHRIPP